MNVGRLLLVACVANVAGCRQLVDDFAVRQPDGGDAGSGCGGTGLPPRPNPGKKPGTLDFVIATRTNDWGDGMDGNLPTYPHLGLNLDGVCTTSSATVSCQPPTGAGVANFTDGDDGIDNGIGRFASMAEHVIPMMTTVTASLQELERSGNAANLLRVRGYNGEANDDQVEVSLFVGTTRPASDMPPAIEPSWQGSDTWFTTTAFLEDGMSLDKPLFVDKKAYVSDHTLVAYFPRAVLGGPFNDFSPLFGIFITGKLVEQDAGRYALQNGVRAGRWPAVGVIAFLAIKISSPKDAPGTGSPCPIAPGDPNYTMYMIDKGAVCAATDIVSEGKDPSMPCDAMSFGVSMDGVPAHIGADVLPIAPPLTCLEDSCAPADGGQVLSAQ